MGQTVSFTCCTDTPTDKPTVTTRPPSHDTTMMPPTPISSLERLMMQPRTLPVILEEERTDSEPKAAKPVRIRRGKRMEVKAIVVRKRLAQGYRGSSGADKGQ